METTRQGGCLCGALRYEISGEPLAVAVCHCPDCQVQSGSAFSMSMLVPRERLFAGSPASPAPGRARLRAAQTSRASSAPAAARGS
jgi:hypothetical protein